jgi:ABC-type Fe3+ transport system substrate-binding protein
MAAPTGKIGRASGAVQGYETSKAGERTDGEDDMAIQFIRLPLAAAALLCLTAGVTLAQTITISPALQAIIDGAKKEGSLTLSYGANVLGGAEGARVGMAGIKKMFGVDVAVNYSPGPSFGIIANRLYTELQAGQPALTDAYNGTAVEITPYLSRGLFRKVLWTELYPGRITPEIDEADGRALRIVTKLPGILYNKRVAPEFAKATMMADLLKPEYRGKLHTEPYIAGFDVLVAKDMWGYDKTAEFVRALSQTIGGLADCGAAGRIASGEVPAIALSCAGVPAHTAIYRDVLGEVVLRDAAMRRFDYIAIPENAAHPNAAILFGLYLSSPDGQQKILHDLFGGELDLYTDTETHQQIATLISEGFHFTDVTMAWWGSHDGISADFGKLTKIIAERQK